MLRIEHLHTAGDEEQYGYVCFNAKSLIYGTPCFMTLVARHLEAQPGWLIAKRDEEVVGVLPFMKKQGGNGPVFNSLAYYGSNGGVIQAKPDDEARARLIQAFYTMAKEEEGVSATLITNPLERDSEFYLKHTDYDLKDERIGQVTHFPSSLDPEDLINIFQDPRPRNIRRAQRAGVTVERRQDQDTLEFLYTTHAANMKAIEGASKRRDFFFLVPQMMKSSDWAVYLAKLGGQPVAALLLFYFNRTVEYFTPVVVEAYRQTQALSLTIYRAMQDAIADGFLNWNWGGTWLCQKGVYDFKKRWGTSDYPYYYFTRLFNEDLTKQSTEVLLKIYSGFYVLPFSAVRTT